MIAGILNRQERTTTRCFRFHAITLRNRVNELGVAEPLVQCQGPNRIVVELPGIQDTVTTKRIIGKTANLEFRLEAKADASSTSSQEFSFKKENKRERTALLEKDIIATGSGVSDANASFDESGLPQVNISLDGTAGKMMLDVTKRAIKRRMAVLFIEQNSEIVRSKVDVKEIQTRRNRETRGIISLATIQGAFGNSIRITGLDSATEAAELA